jgi:hypothetical protein
LNLTNFHDPIISFSVIFFLVEDSLALPVLLLVLACCETASPERKNRSIKRRAVLKFIKQK